jgi:protein gp37
MSDLFYTDRPNAVIDRVVETISYSSHIGQVLTKRAARMAEYLTTARSAETLRRWQRHVWCGFSAEDQRRFDERWQLIRALPERGWTVFVSIAPMLGPVRLPDDFLSHGDRVWAICSGEQGPDARPMDVAWARAVRDQCSAAGVPFFMLQMAHRAPIPADLLIRQFPRVPG